MKQESWLYSASVLGVARPYRECRHVIQWLVPSKDGADNQSLLIPQLQMGRSLVLGTVTDGDGRSHISNNYRSNFGELLELALSVRPSKDGSLSTNA